MADTHLDGRPVWSQWHVRRKRARAKLKALQLMAASGVIRPVHVEFRYQTVIEADRSFTSSEETPRHDVTASYLTSTATRLDSWREWSKPIAQRLRAVSEGILFIQRWLLAELQWGPEKAYSSHRRVY